MYSFYFVCMSVCLPVCMSTTCVLGALRSQKGAWDLLELEFQEVVSCRSG